MQAGAELFPVFRFLNGGTLFGAVGSQDMIMDMLKRNIDLLRGSQHKGLLKKPCDRSVYRLYSCCEAWNIVWRLRLPDRGRS